MALDQNKVIGFDQATYDYRMKKEDEVILMGERLKEAAMKAMGEELDFKKVFDEGFDYLVGKFWDEFGKHEPKHIDREAFLNSKIPTSRSGFESTLNRLKILLNQHGRFAPEVTSTGLVSVIKKEDYNYILDPSKKDEYNDVMKLVQQAEMVHKKYNCGMLPRLIQFHPSIMLNSSRKNDSVSQIRIEPSQFSLK
jgi:hypothetical protein